MFVWCQDLQQQLKELQQSIEDSSELQAEAQRLQQQNQDLARYHALSGPMYNVLFIYCKLLQLTAVSGMCATCQQAQTPQWGPHLYSMTMVCKTEVMHTIHAFMLLAAAVRYALCIS